MASGGVGGSGEAHPWNHHITKKGDMAIIANMTGISTRSSRLPYAMVMRIALYCHRALPWLFSPQMGTPKGL
jgi:hypothetical protein